MGMISRAISCAVLLGGVCAANAGCGNTSNRVSGGRPPTNPVTIPSHITGSRARSYHSFPQLWSDSEVIAVGQVGASRIDTATGVPVPSTVADFTVEQVVAAKHSRLKPGDVVAIRQLGSSQALNIDGPPLLLRSRTYLVFLSPFVGQTGATGEWTVTGGGAGQYRADGPVYQREDPLSGELPETVTIDDIMKTIAAG